jgi:hypothetical protein
MTGAIPDEYQRNDYRGQDYKKYQGKDDAPCGPHSAAKSFPKIDRNKRLNLPCYEAKQPGEQCCLQENISIGKILSSKKKQN